MTNEGVGEHNLCETEVVKIWLVRNVFNLFCKCIGCIISLVTYGNKLRRLWGETNDNDRDKMIYLIQREVHSKIYLLKVVFLPLYF